MRAVICLMPIPVSRHFELMCILATIIKIAIYNLFNIIIIMLFYLFVFVCLFVCLLLMKWLFCLIAKSQWKKSTARRVSRLAHDESKLLQKLVLFGSILLRVAFNLVWIFSRLFKSLAVVRSDRVSPDHMVLFFVTSTTFSWPYGVQEKEERRTYVIFSKKKAVRKNTYTLHNRNARLRM